MITLLQAKFWAFALASVILVPTPLGVSRSVSFGLLNLAALYALLGWSAPAFVLGLASVLWLSAWRREAWLLGPLALLFLAYKLLQGQGSLSLGGQELLREDGLAFSLLSRVGFSYVFLRAWDLLATVRHGKVPLLDPLSLAGYLAPFHMLSAGPVASYAEHAGMNRGAPPPPRFDTLLAGINEVTTGLFYKFVLAEAVRIFAFGVNRPLESRSWPDTALLLVYVFFDFAGYSRVALAIGRLSGVPTPVNFAAPFASTTVTEFWTRWHVSLGAFVRRNIYLPLQVRAVRTLGLRWAYSATMATLVVSFGFVGLWHRVTVGLLAWGASVGAFMALEKLVRDHFLARGLRATGPSAEAIMRLCGQVYVFMVVSTSIHFVVSELINR